MPSQPVDQLWLHSACCLVLLTQAGLICLGSGLRLLTCETPSRTVVNSGLRALTCLLLSVLTFSLAGFSVMFGPSWCGLLGTATTATDSSTAQYLLYHALLGGTGSTIVCGVVGERLGFRPHMLVAGLISGLAYPLLGHWCWGSGFGGADGWLESLGFVDFAGVGVIHAVGPVGLLSVAVFADPTTLDSCLNRASQAGAQCLGVLLLTGVSFGLAYGFLKLLSRITPRSDGDADELVGHDRVECRGVDALSAGPVSDRLQEAAMPAFPGDANSTATSDTSELASDYSGLLDKVAQQSQLAAYAQSQIDKAKQVEQESSFAHSVLNALNAAVCLVDSSGVIVAQNARWHNLRCFGADNPAPGPGERVLDALANSDKRRGKNLAALAEPLSKFLKGQASSYSAVHVARAGEETRWFDVTISEVDLSAVGRATVLSLYDVTERIEAERVAVTAKTHADILTDAFESSQRMLAGTMNAAGIVTWQWDTETGHVQYGDHWADLVGDDHNRIDSSLSELVDRAHPEDQEELESHFLSRIDSDSETEIFCEFRLQSITGEHRWMRVKGRVIQRREEGVPLVFAGIIDDINEKKQAELCSAALSTIIEEASSEMLLFGAGALRVINANRGARENLGYDLESLRELGARELLDEASHESLLAALASRTLSDAWGSAFNGSFVRSDGSTYSLAGRLQRTEYLGEEAIAVHGIDVTEKERLEKQLAQSQKLESIGQLAAGVAHEINTPMQFVSSNIDYLRQSTPKINHLLEDVREMLGDGHLAQSRELRLEEFDSRLAARGFPSLMTNVQGAIEDCVVGSGRVVEIVRAMKDFSHPGAKDKAFANPNQLIKSSSIVCKTSWRYVAELQLDLDPEVPEIPCLPAELNQVFLNLIVNSVDAIAEHRGEDDPLGKIHLRTRWKQDHVLIEVADNGPGIPPEVLQRVFDPFFTTKEVGKGTGQGLAISHDVIDKKHGGSLTVESEPGRGATFRIVLPAGSIASNNALTKAPDARVTV